MRRLTEAERELIAHPADIPAPAWAQIAIMRGPWLHFAAPCEHVSFFAHAHETYEGGPDLRCDRCGPGVRYAFSGGLLWITA